MSCLDYLPLEDGETVAVVKSRHTLFNWRPAGASTAPLNAGCRPTIPPAKRGPKTAGGFAKNGGTMHLLSVKQQELLKPRVFSRACPVAPFRPGGNDGL